MKHKKIYGMLLAVMLIISLSYAGHNYYKQNDRLRALSYDELIVYINKSCLYNKAQNLKVELEKDVDDLHIVLLSYNDMNSNQLVCFVVFDKLANGKYKYNIFQEQPINTADFSMVITPDITSNDQSKDRKFYGLLCGIITDNRPNKFSIKISDKTFTEVVEKNKFFISVYDMGNAQSMVIGPIYDKQ